MAAMRASQSSSILASSAIDSGKIGSLPALLASWPISDERISRASERPPVRLMKWCTAPRDRTR